MSTVVIHGEGLGKSYHRGVLQQSTLLRDHLSCMLKSPLSVFRRPKDETQDSPSNRGTQQAWLRIRILFRSCDDSWISSCLIR